MNKDSSRISINSKPSEDFLAHKTLGKFWFDLSANAGRQRVPIHGHFELTPKCNFDCKMCYVHLNSNQMSKKEIGFEDLKKIIDEAIDKGMMFASLTGGECLTVPYFDELYLYLQQKGIMIFVLTNGYLLDEKMDLFLKHPPAQIQVSVYGWNDDTYYNVTGKRAYSKVVKSVLKANELGINVSVAVTASRFLPRIYNIVKFFYDHNIGVDVSKWIMPPHENTGRHIEDISLTPQEQVEIEYEVRKASKRPSNPPYDKPLPEAGSDNTIPCIGLSCSAGRTDFSINWKGEMTPCAALDFVTGYPLTEGFTQAWEKTVKFADEFERPIECPDCKYKSICNVCPAYHLGMEKGHCNPTACEEVKLMVAKGFSVLDI